MVKLFRDLGQAVFFVQNIPMKSFSTDLVGISVLVTDGHLKHTLGIVRHLGRMKAKVGVVAYHPNDIARASRYCGSVIRVDKPDAPTFLASIRQATTQNHYDLLIPVSYQATLALAQNREFLPNVWMGIADATKIEVAANKNCMAKLAEKVGVRVPRTFVPSCLEDLREFSRDLKYPVVVKPQRETAGYSVTYVNDRKGLLELYAKAFSSEAPNKEPPLVQEFIPGYGCGFFASYQNGDCKRVFMHRRIREYPANGGASTCAESFYHPQLQESGRRLLDSLCWHGVAMAEFRHDSRDGEFKLIEVNPKFWGSLDLALAAGADFPGDLCRMAAGQNLKFTNQYQRNLRFHWPFSVSGEIHHLWRRPRSLLDVTLDFVNPRVKSNVWLSDFGPNYQELRSLGGILLRKKSR